MIGIGHQAERKVTDWNLSRFACYLIAQNGDPRKREIAEAQKYFAIQTAQKNLGKSTLTHRQTGHVNRAVGLTIRVPESR
ncbi:MAG: hypothetical protein HW387_719, partial [Parachlamydiales bacterium]|nr:hypothetical protein [Parachlamydiales bacterium]